MKIPLYAKDLQTILELGAPEGMVVVDKEEALMRRIIKLEQEKEELLGRLEKNSAKLDLANRFGKGTKKTHDRRKRKCKVECLIALII